MIDLVDALRLESYAIAATPLNVRSLFDRQVSPEGCWDWFEILADTTLSQKESARIFALLDEGGRPVCAVPLVAVDGQIVRGLTSPFTTLFCAPFGHDGDARTLGKLLAAEIGATFRLWIPPTAPPGLFRRGWPVAGWRSRGSGISPTGLNG